MHPKRIAINLLLSLLLPATFVLIPMASAQGAIGTSYTSGPVGFQVAIDTNDSNYFWDQCYANNVAIGYHNVGFTYTIPSDVTSVSFHCANEEGAVSNTIVFTVTQPDSDGDGITDNNDSCPNEGDQGFGLGGNGCPIPPPPSDRDSDGLPDDQDACPDQGDQGFGLGGNGCPIPPPPSDRDSDGLPDDQDACPDQGDQGFGLSGDGCPIPPPPSDRDSDGLPDDQDSCPDQGDQGFGLSGDGCPIPPPPSDRDSDGFPDDQDACPDQGDQGFGLSGDGCPIPPPQPSDSDNDGVLDSDDACPNEGDQGFGLGGNGCPNPPPADTTSDNDTSDDTDPIIAPEPVTEPEPIPETINTTPVACIDSASYLPARLAVNGSGKLVAGQNALNLRSSAGTNSVLQGSLATADIFDVLEGPLCNQEGDSYYRWWRVQVNGNPSWLAESNGSVYYVEPVILSAPVSEPVAEPERVANGNGCINQDWDCDGFHPTSIPPDACPSVFGEAPDGCPTDDIVDPVTGEKVVCTNQFDGTGDYPRNVDAGFGFLDNRCPITDIDADEIPDYIDACPSVGDQGFGVLPNGCPLFEGDTIDNICTSQATGIGHYPRNVDAGFGLLPDGCPITDIDADEVPDGADACPLFGDQGFGVDATGCPNTNVATNRGVNLLTLNCLDESLDCDGDGYSNKWDRCPFTGATAGNTTSWVNGRLGCPKIEAELTADVVCGDADLVSRVVIGCILAFENLKQLPEVNTGAGFDFFHPDGITSPPNPAIGPAALEMCNVNNLFSIELSTEVWSAKVPGSVWVEYCQKSYLLLKISTADYKVQILNDELERQRLLEEEQERIEEYQRQQEAEKRWRIRYRKIQLAEVAAFNRLREWEEQQRRRSGFIGGVRTFLRTGGKLVKDIGEGIVENAPKALGCAIDESLDKVTFGKAGRIKNDNGLGAFPGWRRGECTTFQ